jgi:hypothetical protein
MYYVYCIFGVEVICSIYHILFLYYRNLFYMNKQTLSNQTAITLDITTCK